MINNQIIYIILLKIVLKKQCMWVGSSYFGNINKKQHLQYCLFQLNNFVDEISSG